MSAASSAEGPGFSPKQSSPSGRTAHANATFESTAKYNREDNGLQLILKNVIGTTTRSTNAFDALPEQHSFVCCAGPTAVLFHLDEQLNISQRFFRAKPKVLPVNGTRSFYKTSTPPITPTRSRHGSPLKAQGLGIGSTASSISTPDVPSQSGVGNRSSEASCVCLNPEGNLLAVGEVKE